MLNESGGGGGDVFDGNDDSQRERKLAEMLAQWPISVDFKLPPQQQQQQRQCQSLADGGQLLANRCHTTKSSSAEHVCRCDRFGFLALFANAPSQMLQVPLAGADFQWPPAPLEPAYGESEQAGRPDSAALPDYIGPAQTKPAQQHQQALGFWTTAFIVVGLLLFVITLAALIANATLRANAQSRLGKKQQDFLTGGGAASMLAHHRDLSAGPTTGPLTDHSLMSDEQLITGGTNTAAGTTQSSSIIGLSGHAAGYHEPGCYKAAHQQLYAAHLAPMGPLGGPANRWTSWARWLRPSRWLSSSASHSKELMIQHRVIGNSSLASAGSLAHYKGQYQNGYTTNLHQSPAVAQMPLNAPSSSTSSYVSSSAYYEEIGPGNLTRVSTNQLSRPTHTVVDPFKPRQPVADQQQHQHLMSHHPQPVQHSLAQWSAGAGPPPMEAQQHQQQQPISGFGQPALNNYKQFHTDLSQLQNGNSQSSSSSAGSQHSASTNLTSANGSTPRHYLFASPSAVTAYKSSMSHYPAYQPHPHHQHHHQ